jgi:DNA-binding Lrp family transcriptional regulator
MKRAVRQLETETVIIADAFKSFRRINKQLDPVNMKILLTMWKIGPRNLLEIARTLHMPFTSVHRRVQALENESGRVAYLIPRLSRLGMTRLVVLVSAKTGYEEQTALALKLPNLWRSINSCEGHFTHQSVHAVPVKYLNDFTTYMRQLLKVGLVTRLRIIRTGEQYSNFPNFKYYDFKTNKWTLPWGKWLEQMVRSKPSEEELDPADYSTVIDKRDLIIVKELEKNARKTFAEIAKTIGISLQAVKQRFDKKLVPRGIIGNYAIDVIPYPMEVSAYHEVMLEFPSERTLRQFFNFRDKLFFILGTSKELHRNALVIRTCILESQAQNMFKFFSAMAKAKLLTSFSAVRMSLANREPQVIFDSIFIGIL